MPSMTVNTITPKGEKILVIDAVVDGEKKTLKAWKSSAYANALQALAGTGETAAVELEERATNGYTDTFIKSLNGVAEKPAGRGGGNQGAGGGGGWRKPDRAPGAEAAIAAECALKALVDLIDHERERIHRVEMFNAQRGNRDASAKSDYFPIATLMRQATDAMEATIKQLSPLMEAK